MGILGVWVFGGEEGVDDDDDFGVCFVPPIRTPPAMSLRVWLRIMPAIVERW